MLTEAREAPSTAPTRPRRRGDAAGACLLTVLATIAGVWAVTRVVGTTEGFLALVVAAVAGCAVGYARRDSSAWVTGAVVGAVAGGAMLTILLRALSQLE